MIKLQKFIFNPFAENTYLLWEENSKESMIIDPGCSNEYEESVIKEFLVKQQLNLKYMVNTHCHVDHISGNAFIKKNFNPEFLAPEKDIFLLNEKENDPVNFGISVEKSPLPDTYLNEQVKLNLGGSEISFLHTPGHTPGEFCVYLKDEKICITGDVLFYEGIGRTDLWGGNHNQLISSIKNILFNLPDETTCYPGHGAETTIAYEKKNNPFL